MNSQRRWRGPLWTCVVGRRGIAPLARGRQVGERGHVVRLGVDDEPALLEAEVAAADPDRLAHERVGAVGADDPARPHRPRLVGGVSRPARSSDGVSVSAAVGLVDEPLGDPAALDG